MAGTLNFLPDDNGRGTALTSPATPAKPPERKEQELKAYGEPAEKVGAASRFQDG